MVINPINPNQTEFSRFGSIVIQPKDLPLSQTEEYQYWSNIAHYHIDGDTEIGLCTVFRRSTPVIAEVERHLKTPEILIPIDAPFVLPLLREGEDEDKMQAFTVDIGQAVVIESGVWHSACFPVSKPQASYFVIFRQGTPHEDVYKKSILSPILLQY
ncbi:MAG: hypothetical protein EHM72_16270 [Calditrichaeota bacterium]|nr:MAG: hypothetical protein EHM72_16270 [Calditrichota bacterium]